MSIRDRQDKANRRVLFTSLAVVIGMTGFAYALVPLYDIFCEITGLNGKTGRLEVEQALSARKDENRLITIQFDASLNANSPWDFRPKVKSMQVHPGEIAQASYIARNLSGRAIVGQAVPSVAPSAAGRYFNKTECFCFTEQKFEAGQELDMPLRFVVDPNLPKDVHTITLSYTFFDSKRPAKAAASKVHKQVKDGA